MSPLRLSLRSPSPLRRALQASLRFGALGLALALGSAAALAPAPASAAGFYIADIGTRGMARGGAFVAAPDSLVALHYNPAALSLLGGLQAEASLSIVQMDLDYQRHCPCLSASNPDAASLDQMLERSFTPSTSSTPLAIPFIGLAYGLPVYDLTVGFAAYGPNSGRHDWGSLPPATSPIFARAAATSSQRYSAMEVKNLEANFVLGAAGRPFPSLVPGLRLGATVMIYQSGSDQSANLWANSRTFANQPEDAQFDVPLVVNFKENFAVSWSVGASYEILPGLTLGGSFRPKRHISSDGTVAVDLPELLTNVGAKIEGNVVGIELETAAIVRGGLQYELPRVFKIEGAVVGELWSAHQQIVVSPKNISFTLGSTSQALGDIVLDRHWRDTYSLRVGGELNLFEPLLGVQAGYFYEPSAIPADRVDASRVDLDKHGFGLGLSTELWGVRLDVAAMYVALVSTQVRDSKVLIKAPLSEESGLGATTYNTVIGNGDYSGSYFIGSAALSFKLDTAMGYSTRR